MRSQSRLFSQPFRKAYRHRSSPRLVRMRAAKKLKFKKARRARRRAAHSAPLRVPPNSPTPAALRKGRLLPAYDEPGRFPHRSHVRFER